MYCVSLFIYSEWNNEVEPTKLICVFCFKLCWIIKLSATSTTGLIIARICCGIPAGGCFNLIPMYVKEISQDSIRGLLGSLLILMQNIGILSMYAMGSHLDYKTVLWSVLGIPILTVVLMIKAPESPAFLVKVGKVKVSWGFYFPHRKVQIR